ncbi:DUF805 domain-containing protein [Prevotella sp. PCHR]|uniref:DUF805 domain-containing protein n=1 Tax=Xylanibacter caecicola TaxID=2736294 RepID=A0ABX2B8L1_9BACT|nr:DUF805 domain-containing protein [Xylanibacter caecicola]NPE26360.1 DUF805 domain-containing protein [Xylanibacter caecicola]
MKQNYNKRLSFKEALYNCYTNPSFKGRARRSEFWWNNLLFCMIIFSITNIEAFLSNKEGSLGSILVFLLIITALVVVYFEIAITFRRLHDIGRSGWWAGALYMMRLLNDLATQYIDYETASLLSFINVVYFVFLIGFCSMDSMKETNKYGKSPKYNL